MWSKDDVELFLTEHWPDAMRRRFTFGQAFYVFLQSAMHYDWAFGQYEKLHSFQTNEDAEAYVRSAAR